MLYTLHSIKASIILTHLLNGFFPPPHKRKIAFIIKSLPNHLNKSALEEELVKIFSMHPSHMKHT